jgi:mono/diheme cytochrome c family protein
MRDDVRPVIYGTIVLFLLVVLVWIGTLFVFSCGLNFACGQAAPKVDRTSIPTLSQAKFVVPTRFVIPTVAPTLALTPIGTEAETSHPLPGGEDIARPSNPGGPGQAIGMQGNVDSGKELYTQNCAYCHADEGKGEQPNPGSLDGTVPALNPIDSTLVSSDYTTFATNIDLFIEHGSVPEGPNPARIMPAWGDRGALTPQQIADLIAYIISLNPK